MQCISSEMTRVSLHSYTHRIKLLLQHCLFEKHKQQNQYFKLLGGSCFSAGKDGGPPGSTFPVVILFSQQGPSSKEYHIQGLEVLQGGRKKREGARFCLSRCPPVMVPFLAWTSPSIVTQLILSVMAMTLLAVAPSLQIIHLPKTCSRTRPVTQK